MDYLTKMLSGTKIQVACGVTLFFDKIEVSKSTGQTWVYFVCNGCTTCRVGRVTFPNGDRKFLRFGGTYHLTPGDGFRVLLERL